MTTETPKETLDDIKLYHSFVPHKYRLLTLIAIARARANSKLVVACCSTEVAEFNKILFNSFLDIRCDAIHGKQDRKQQERSIERFNTGEVNLLFATSLLLTTVKISKPEWLIHYDIPKEVPEELKIIQNIHPEKFVLLIDESHKKYLDLLKQVKINTEEIKYDTNKLPPLQDKIMKFTNDKSHLLYMASQIGYRDLIDTYVNHENNNIFNARELNLLDVSVNFGIKYPPKRPLSK